MKKILPLLLNIKIQLILLFCITFLIGIIFIDFKTGLGKDEQYIENGFNSINNGFENSGWNNLKSYLGYLLYLHFFTIIAEMSTGIKLMYILSLIELHFLNFISL